MKILIIGGSGFIGGNFYNPTTLYTSNTTSEVKIKFAIKAVNTSMAITTTWGDAGTLDAAVSRCTLLEVGA